MCSVTIRESGGDALLIVRIGGVSEMEKKSRYLVLLRRGERRDVVFDVFDAHGKENADYSTQSKRADSPSAPKFSDRRGAWLGIAVIWI